MNAAKMSLMSTILAAALGLALGLAAAPAMADQPVCPGHDHGCGGGNPDPTLEMCLTSPCIADVGKTHTDNTPARQFLGEMHYIQIGSKDFDRILETLTEGDPAGALCDAYDVLIFNWNSPTIKKLNWQRLLDYMECGGGVIFEDPRNVGLLAAGVGTLEVTVHSRDDFPLTITLEPVGPLNGPPPSPSFNLVFVNKHIIFDVPSSDGDLRPFLSLPLQDEAVVGLYGEFGDGRIVLTGPDNNFHGDFNADANDPAKEHKLNHINLLFDEIDWLLE